MANPVSAEDISGWLIKPYLDVRPSLKSGDLLFCCGNYTVSKLLETATGSPWSHVGIVVVAKSIDRVLLLESVEDVGVRLAPLSKYVKDYENGAPYDGILVLASSTAVTEQKMIPIAQFGADRLTLPYDNGEIGEIIARIALGLGRKTATSGYICSELVAACFSAAGIVIKSGGGGFITPQDVWVDNSVERIARIQ